MRRNLDIIWAILLEAAAEDGSVFHDIDSEDLEEHFRFMEQDGYFDEDGRLTDAGREFIRVAIDPKKWLAAEHLISESSVGIPVRDLIASIRGKAVESET